MGGRGRKKYWYSVLSLFFIQFDTPKPWNSATHVEGGSSHSINLTQAIFHKHA